jgi:hypothetical protein
VQSSAFELSLRRPAPGLGEHTREVLEELGLTSAEIEALAAAGTISLGGPLNRRGLDNELLAARPVLAH